MSATQNNPTNTSEIFKRDLAQLCTCLEGVINLQPGYRPVMHMNGNIEHIQMPMKFGDSRQSNDVQLIDQKLNFFVNDNH